jgi:hypothetical protein
MVIDNKLTARLVSSRLLLLVWTMVQRWMLIGGIDEQIQCHNDHSLPVPCSRHEQFLDSIRVFDSKYKKEMLTIQYYKLYIIAIVLVW